MRLLFYRISVFLIQILGRVNERLLPYETKRILRTDRLCYAEYEDAGGSLGKCVHISCCDCGASHYFWKANNGIYGIPVRPDNYQYSPRLPGDPIFADEEAKRKWDIGR